MAEQDGTGWAWDDGLRVLILMVVLAPTLIYYLGLALIPAGPMVCAVGAVLGILTLIGLWPARRHLDGAAGRGLYSGILIGLSLSPVVMPGLAFLAQ
ncbi:MAG: hypothetical protein GY791_01940 [Alphaproteobacteria bacterium]|nr:hypothetical protein [Alphaproteobacteria bacterium]